MGHILRIWAIFSQGHILLLPPRRAFHYRCYFCVERYNTAASIRNYVKRYKLKTSTVCQLFDAFVGATLNYGCEIWGFSKATEIERVHLKFCKFVLGVKRSTTNMGVYGELGRYPLYIERYVRIIKFWCKLILCDNIIVNKLYNSLTNAKTSRNNWTCRVKALLDSYGFSGVWRDPYSVNLGSFHIQFKARVLDVFKQQWYVAISTCRTLCTYRYLKPTCDFEQYLDVLPFKFRTAISRLRLSSHKLQVEIGRYSQNRTEKSQRLCKLCNSNDVEDEYHFVIICPVYATFRKQLIKPYYYRRPSVFKFIELMNSSNDSILRKLSKYVYDAMTLRKSLVNCDA